MAKLWRLPGGEFIGAIGHHQSSVGRLAFSGGGTLLASSQEGLIRVWRLAWPPLVRSIPVDGPSLAILSQDGHLLAPSGRSGRGIPSLNRTRVIDVRSGNDVGPEIVPGGAIIDAAFSPDAAWLAIIVRTTADEIVRTRSPVAGSGNLQLWDYRSGQRLGEPIPLPSEPRSLAIHPSGNWIGVCCNGGKGVEVELATRQTRVLFDDQQHTHGFQTLNNGQWAYSPDGTLFAVYGTEPLTHLWNRREDRELIDPRRFGGFSFDLTFGSNTIAIALRASPSRIEFLDARTGAQAVPPIAYGGWPFLVRFSADNSLLLTTGRNRVGEVWDWRKGVRVCPALPHDHEVMAGAFILGKPWVATGGHDAMIKFWDARTGMQIRPPIRRNRWVLRLQATPDGRTLVASADQEPIELFAVETLFPEPDLPPEEARLLAEIDAAATVHPGGDLVPLTKEAWLERWQTFRKRHPDYPGHRLNK